MSMKIFKDIIPLLGGINYVWAQVQIGTRSEQYVSGYSTSNRTTSTVRRYSSSSSAQSAARSMVPSGARIVDVKTSTYTPSNDYHSNTASTVEERQVNSYYQQYMRRNADAGGLQTWVSHKNTSGKSWQQIRDMILREAAFNSREYITSSGISRLNQLGYDTSSVRTFTTTYSAYAVYQDPIYATRQVPVYEWQWVEE